MDAINDWENQALTHRNRLAPHAYFMGYETADLAATYSRELSRGFVQLSGSWQFRLFEGPAAVSNEELSTYKPEWDHVEVPHLWQVTAMATLPTPTRVSRSRLISRSFPPTTPRRLPAHRQPSRRSCRRSRDHSLRRHRELWRAVRQRSVYRA